MKRLFLSRLFHQINEYNFTNVVVVTSQRSINFGISQYLSIKSKVIFNKHYKEDVNILMKSFNIDEKTCNI